MALRSRSVYPTRSTTNDFNKREISLIVIGTTLHDSARAPSDSQDLGSKSSNSEVGPVEGCSRAAYCAGVCAGDSRGLGRIRIMVRMRIGIQNK